MNLIKQSYSHRYQQEMFNLPKFDPNGPIHKDPEVGLVVPPWAPSEMRTQMASLPREQKENIMKKQNVSVKAALGILKGTMQAPTAEDINGTPSDSQYKQWLGMEYKNMVQMMKNGGGMPGGGGGGHSHGGKPCAGHGGGGGGHGGHGHDHGGHSHGGKPCQGHGGHGGHGAHGGGGGGGGHSHGGKPCQGHGGHGGGGHGHSHGGEAGGYAGAGPPTIFNELTGILHNEVTIDIPSKVDTTYTTDKSGLILPKWLGLREQYAFDQMSADRKRALKRHQSVVIRASNNKLTGTLNKPSDEDVQSPSEEDVKTWINREWTKINLMTPAEPLPQALVGQWVYGRRNDGSLSSYEFREVSGEVRYFEETIGEGPPKEGVLKSGSEVLEIPKGITFRPNWFVELARGEGLLWFRKMDGVTIESLFVADGKSTKGFKAIARRGFSLLGGAPETSDIMMADVHMDKETGLVLPPWAPAAAREQMMTLPAKERIRIKTMQDATIRRNFNLPEDTEISLELTKKWMKSSYEQMMQTQAHISKLPPGKREEFIMEKAREQMQTMQAMSGATMPSGEKALNPAVGSKEHITSMNQASPSAEVEMVCVIFFSCIIS